MPLPKSNWGYQSMKEAWETEHHFHGKERWLGKSADQSGNDWALESGLTVFTATSGSGDFGGDANDEAKVLGTADTPVVAGNTRFDFHHVLFVALSTDTPWIIRIVWDETDMATGVAAGNYSTFMVQNNPSGSKAGGVPIPVMMPRLHAGTDKVWMQAKNATDNATATFFIGLHEYDD